MRTAILLAAIGRAAMPAHAQPAESRRTLSVITGRATRLDDERVLGAGSLLGLAAHRVAFGRTRAEASLEILTHDRDSGSFRSNVQTVIGGLSLVRRFGSAGVQPYLFGGFTVGYHSGTNYFNGDPVSHSTTNPGLRFG